MQAQTPNPPQSDVLIFTDGEQVIGQLERATSSSLTFKSDVAGELTVDWSKVRELRSSRRFAVIPKGVELQNADAIPRGTITVTGGQVHLNPGSQGAQQTIPVANIGTLVDEVSFLNAFRRASFLEDWKGGATAGISITEATQTNKTFTGTVNLSRTVPSETWISPKRRTLFNFNEAYGELTQPSTPSIKTSLFHLGAEEDWYLSPRLFTFGQAVLDHNVSQGLDLQQTYGGGIGFVVFKRAHDELDLKASGDYIDQRFTDSSLNQHLFGSIFGETYLRTFVHGILLNQQAGITPAWTNLDAYSAFASAALTFPVYHRFGLTVGALDNFLNNPPPQFKKNSFQFTVGATYSLP